jgi:hypothetical protein
VSTPNFRPVKFLDFSEKEVYYGWGMLKDGKTYLIGSFVLLLVTCAYLFGKAQTLSGVKIPQQSPQVEAVMAEVTPVPTTKTVVIYKTPVPTSTQAPERKKVSVYIDDSGGITRGTFYCYEDKVNYLSGLQNKIRLGQLAHETCTANAQLEGKGCSDTNCNSLTDTTEITNCIKKCVDDAFAKCNSDLGDLRYQLNDDVHKYCP